MLRRILAALIADDPQPELSQLDRRDGLTAGPVSDRCAVIACPNPPVTSIHGWSLCATHRNAYTVSSK